MYKRIEKVTVYDERLCVTQTNEKVFFTPLKNDVIIVPEGLKRNGF